MSTLEYFAGIFSRKGIRTAATRGRHKSLGARPGVPDTLNPAASSRASLACLNSGPVVPKCSPPPPLPQTYKLKHVRVRTRAHHNGQRTSHNGHHSLGGRAVPRTSRPPTYEPSRVHGSPPTPGPALGKNLVSPAGTNAARRATLEAASSSS